MFVEFSDIKRSGQIMPGIKTALSQGNLVEYGDCLTECDSFKNPLRARITHHTALAVWPVSYVCPQPNHQGRRQPWTAFLYLLGVTSNMVYP